MNINHTKILRTVTLPIAALITCAVSSLQAATTTLFDDDFSSGSVPSVIGGFSVSPRSVVSFDSSNALQIQWNGTNTSAWIRLNSDNSGQALEIGDSLNASFSLAFRNSAGDDPLSPEPSPFRFGFLNAQSFNGSNVPQSTSGVGFSNNFAAASANSAFAVVKTNTSTNGGDIFGTFSAGQASAGDYGVSLYGTVSYTMTRSAADTYDVDLELTPNGESTVVYSFANNSYSLADDFHVFAISNRAFGSSTDPRPQILMDDVVVTYSSIPEPTTYAALFGLAAMGLVFWRRQNC